MRVTLCGAGNAALQGMRAVHGDQGSAAVPMPRLLHWYGMQGRMRAGLDGFFCNAAAMFRRLVFSDRMV